MTGRSPSEPTSSSWAAATPGPWRRSSWRGAGRRVTLLERHTLGWGASTRNGGIFHPGPQVGPGRAPAALRTGARRPAVPGRRRRLLHRRAVRHRRRLRLRLPALGSGHPRLVERASSTASRRSSRSCGTRACGAGAYRGAEIHQEIGSDALSGRHRHRGVGHDPSRAGTSRASCPPAQAAGVDFHTGTPAERIEVDRRRPRRAHAAGRHPRRCRAHRHQRLHRRPGALDPRSGSCPSAATSSRPSP